MRVFTHLAHLPDFQKTVITIGSFDGVHTGHRRILERVQMLARAQGAESVVITFDPHPRTVLRPDDHNFKLITTTAEKIALLRATGIDHVVVAPFDAEFSQRTAQQYIVDFLVKNFRPATIVIGYDHRFGHDRAGGIELLKEYAPVYNFQVVEISAQEVDDMAVSSSKIRKALESSDCLLANRLLEHPYTLSGEVVYGDQIGRTIGFPTANLQIADPYKLILPDGIYAARVLDHAAMLYIGTRPVLEGRTERRIEVNLIDFEGDLYGQHLMVEVLDFIRPDKKLDGLPALQAQIEADKVIIVQKFKSLKVQGSKVQEFKVQSSRVQGVEVQEFKVQGSSVQEGEVQGSSVQNSGETEGVWDQNGDNTGALSVETGETSDSALRTTIVILNYNTRSHLEQYLPSVLAHSAGARIVVADNGSPDDSIDFLKTHYPQVEIVDLEQNWGFAEGYNRALAQISDTDIYVILNSDVAVTAGWMQPIIAAMQADPTIGIAQPKILADQHRTHFEHAGAAGGWIDALGYPFCRGRMFNYTEADTGQYDTPQECFWAAGAAFFIRAKLYHSFGGFDADYFAHNEEIDLSWRLKRAGYSVWCIPQSTVFHLGGGTLGYESPHKVYLNFRNSLFTLLKNESAATLCWLIPARLLLDGVAAIMFATKGQFKSIRAILQAHGAFYSGFSTMLQKREMIRQRIENQRIQPGFNRAGTYWGSVVFAHYLRRVKTFSKL